MSRGRDLAPILERLAAFDVEAQLILASHEASSSRVITLEQSYQRLTGLSLGQDELFREAFRAVEASLFRAAHVLAWAGFIDYLHNFLLPAHEHALAVSQTKWRLAAAEDLRDQSDYQVIEAAKSGHVFGKTVMKALHGLLNKRNECAHPSAYFPDLNSTLGYISELLSRIERFEASRP
jgi:hypothetical protein